MSGQITDFVGRVGSGNVDPRATLGQHRPKMSVTGHSLNSKVSFILLILTLIKISIRIRPKYQLIKIRITDISNQLALTDKGRFINKLQNGTVLLFFKI